MTAPVRARLWRCRRCDFEWENPVPVFGGSVQHRHDGLLCQGVFDPVDPVPAECDGQMSLLDGAA